jgi:hypothetical protein
LQSAIKLWLAGKLPVHELDASLTPVGTATARIIR